MAMSAAALGRFKPYPKYKDSGVEWLGEIPAGWEVKRLKHLALLNPEALPEDTDPTLEMVYVDIGGVDSLGRIVGRELLTFGSAPSRARRLVCHGDVIISTVRTYLRAITPISNPEPGLVVSTGFAVVRPAEDLTTGYAAYALRAPYFVERVVANSKGVSFPAINESEMATYELAKPPEPEQRAIASFLDRETARIDALVAKKERLIDLLQEKRASLVERAVRGDPEGLETKLGYYVDLLPGYAFSSSEFSPDPEDVRLLRGVNIAPGAIRWEDTAYWPPGDSARFGPYRLKPGDLVFGMDRPWIESGIRVAAVSVADVPSLLLQRVARLRAKRGLTQGFLLLVLSSPQFRAYFEPILTGVSVPHVSPDQILSFQLRLPEPDVQETVHRRIQEEAARIESMQEILTESIWRLREFRTALISAAVTGKIDVRGEIA
jgi:type I restriction enzyme S subunit